MHGFIFIELEKFVINEFGFTVWKEVKETNELTDRVYEADITYSDQELHAIINSVANTTAIEVPNLLEKFGISLVPNLMKVYRAYIKPEWKTLDMLENTESGMHTEVRRSTKGAAPPILITHRIRPNEIEIEYVSGRGMVEFGVGLIKGIADYYNESNHIQIDLRKDIEPGKSIINVRYY